MTPTSVFRKAILASVISSTLALTGCGGSDDDSSSENAPQTPASNKAPTVSIGGEDQAKEQTEFKLSAEAADSDGSIASYEWTYQSDMDLTVSGADSAELTVTSANISEDKAVTFTLTVTDDDGATASVDKAIVIKRKVSSVTITGIVTDKPIVNANLTIFAGSASVNAFADETGRYTATFSVDESEADSLVQIRATGLGDQDNVEFVSQLNSMNKLVEQAGEDGELISDENFGVNITNVSTAEYALLTREGETFSTDEELQQALLNVDAEEKLKLAALIKIVVDNDDYELPEGVESTLDLVDDAATAAQFETEVNARDSEIIKKTEEEIKNDDDLVSGNTGSLVGDYIIHNPQYVTTAAYHLTLAEDGKGTVAAVNQVDISSWTNTDGNVELVLAVPLIISQSEVAVRDEFGNVVTDDQGNIVYDTVVYKTSKLNLKVISANEVFRSIDFVTNAQRYVNGTLDETSEANTSIYSSNLLDKSKTLAVEKSDLVATWYLDIYERNYIGDDALNVQKLVFNEDGTITGAGENETVTWSVENNVLTINYTDADYKGSSHFWITKSLAAGYQFVVLDNGRIKEDGSVDINDVHAKSEWGWLFKQDASLAMEEKDVIGRWTGFIGFDQDRYDMNVDEDLNVSIGLNPPSWAGRFEDGVFYRERYEQDGNYVSFCDISLDNCERGLMTHEFVAVADDKYFIRRIYEWDGNVQGDALLIYEYSPETEYTEFTAGLLQSGTTFFTYDTEGNLVEGSFTYSTQPVGNEERFVSELSIGEQTFTFSLVDGKLVYNTANGNYVVELIELTDTGIAVCTYPEGESCTDANKSTWLFEMPHLGEFFINNPETFFSQTYRIEMRDEGGTLHSQGTFTDAINFSWQLNDGLEIIPDYNRRYQGNIGGEITYAIIEKLKLNISADNSVEVEETLRLEDRYGDYLRTEIFQFNSKKFDKSVASNISNEDLIGKWTVNSYSIFSSYSPETEQGYGSGSLLLDDGGVGTFTNVNDREYTITWSFDEEGLKVLNSETANETTFLITKSLEAGGYQVIEDYQLDAGMYSATSSGLLLKDTSNIELSEEQWLGRWLYISGENQTDETGSMEIYDGLSAKYGLNNSNYKHYYEDKKLVRRRFDNALTGDFDTSCDLDKPDCILHDEWKLRPVAQNDNQYFVEAKRQRFNEDGTVRRNYQYLWTYNKAESIQIDGFKEYMIDNFMLQDISDPVNPVIWQGITTGIEGEQTQYALKIGDSEPMPYTFTDGRITVRMQDGFVYNIELVPNSNTKDGVTFCQYLVSESCETGEQIQLSFLN
ncbi:hypothetical protein CWB73_12160 [Pseudoalteromonas phenolica]|uniref:PKD/Chitinase domain-containing protein n=1 Tax=Pseudoalteromonas phenolica TaxID=161398 RepID=A0A5S3YTS5_9GAMM|nr:hypothetical protein [Pseudoalteromonas phenolica]TMP80025.1 hypothetical protein CWB73_12160 [Pseudoalteromonas phenolica]